MTAECTRGGKLTELVPYHVFGNIYGNKFITIVYCKSMPYEFG